MSLKAVLFICSWRAGPGTVGWSCRADIVASRLVVLDRVTTVAVRRSCSGNNSVGPKFHFNNENRFGHWSANFGRDAPKVAPQDGAPLAISVRDGWDTRGAHSQAIAAAK